MLNHIRHIIFATNFSDACYSAIPSVARWVDQLQCRLTILHVHNPNHVLRRDAESLLQSFFAEADNYPDCQRILMAGSAINGITQYCENKRDTLLLLPPSDQAGLPRPWHRSLRAEMITRLSIPVWTLGRTLVGEPMPTSRGHLAALVTNPEEGTEHLRHAARYAAATNSTLHLLHVVPDVDEGSLTHTLTTEAPLGTRYAESWLSDIANSLEPAVRLELHIKQGSTRRLLPGLLSRSGADTLFISRHAALGSMFFRPVVNPIFSKLSVGILSIPAPQESAALVRLNALTRSLATA